MAQDITSSIDRTGLTGADPTADKADVLNAINDLITVINSILNGGQAFDQINFETATELTISSGAITVVQGVHLVDTESDAASDNLDTITASDGDWGFLLPANTDRTVVIKHGTGNIITYDGNDISLDTNSKMVQYVCILSSVWILPVGASDASGIGYTPATAGNWDSDTDPGNVDDALDQLAAARTAVAILRDEKATTTNGGSSSATTWNNRDLNTEVYDGQNIVTISSNQFTPIAGVYKLTASAPSFRAGLNRLRLYNVTGAASVDEGMCTTGDTAVGATGATAFLTAYFSANGTDAYRIDHYTSAAFATSGLGAAVSDGSNEVYLEIVLEKIG